MIERLWDETINKTLREALGGFADVLDVLTHLGDGPVLIAVAILIYWFGGADTRRKRAFVIAVGTAAFALAAGLKGVFELPRPDLAFTPEYYPGYTFPSAHAMGAAAFYGALAVTMTSGKRWHRYAVAGIIIFLVSLSRVTKGVHFLGDVIIGAALGLLLVWLGLRWRREGIFRPGIVFVFAGMIAIATVVLGSREYASLVIGAGFGGAYGWALVVDRETSQSGAAILVTGVGILLGLGIIQLVMSFLSSPIPGGAGSLVFIAEILAYGLLTALVMVTPAIALTVEQYSFVQTLQRVLPFRRRTVELEM